MEHFDQHRVERSTQPLHTELLSKNGRLNEADPLLEELMQGTSPLARHLHTLSAEEQTRFAHEIIGAGGLMVETDIDVERNEEELRVIQDAITEFMSIDDKKARSGLAKEIIRMLQV